MHRLIVALVALAGLLPGARLQAEDPAPLSLFNGENLDGWHVNHCQAAVEDGKLVLLEGNGWLRSDYVYRDFVLELEWRPRKEAMYDSGVYFRAAVPPEGKPWPGKYQVNLKQGEEGNVTRMPEAVSKGLYKPGEWNRMKLTVIGTKAEMEINGQPAWKVDGIKDPAGYIGFQCEEPLGGQFEFRNISIIELGYQSMFNGRDFAGWVGGDKDASTCWKVDNGDLLCTGKAGTWLRSEKEYGDFTLRFDYKIKSGGNSGVYVRVPKNGNHHGKDEGVEVQILDDRSDRYKELKPYQYCGGVYDFAGPTAKVGRPAGEWNSLEIACRGGDYHVTHNGFEIVHAKAADYPGLGDRLKRGYLGLQNHSEEVWFRNIRIDAE